jgi:hypothetical protein
MALPNLTYDAVDLLRARAWNAAAQGHLPRARSLCEDATALGRKTGDLVVASSHCIAWPGSAGLGTWCAVSPSWNSRWSRG